MKINKKGFTLIELLIVIAILGTLAVVVLIALNPLQQLARTRDAGRTSTLTQLGHVLEAYSTTHGGNFPTVNATWMDSLVTAGELNAAPSLISNSTCTGTSQNGICYAATDDVGAVIWTDVEATSNLNRCDGSGCTSFASPVWAYSTTMGRGGLVCGAAPAVGATVTFCDE